MIDIKIINHAGREEELVELFKNSFNLEMSLNYWRWKYLENPINPREPKLVVAVDKERIVGARPLMLAKLRIGQQILSVAQPCDTMVHPEYRRKGIFKRMNIMAINYYQEQEMGLFYNIPNSMSRSGYLKQGWKKVLQIENLLYLNNASAVITEKLGNPLLGKVLGFFYNILPKQTHDLDKEINQDYYVSISYSFPEELRKIDSLYNVECIEIVRSEKYLNWRFDKHPVNIYTYIIVKKREELLGYAVIKSVNENGLKTGRIVDYLVKNNDLDCFRALMYYSLVEFKKSDCDIIIFGYIYNSDFQKVLLSQFGFISPLSFPYNYFIKGENFLVARELNKNLINQIDIYDQSNWNLTYLYADTA